MIFPPSSFPFGAPCGAPTPLFVPRWSDWTKQTRRLSEVFPALFGDVPIPVSGAAVDDSSQARPLPLRHGQQRYARAIAKALNRHPGQPRHIAVQNEA